MTHWDNRTIIKSSKRNCVRNTQDTTTLTATTSWTGHPTAAENWPWQTECTPVQQQYNRIARNLPLQHHSNDQQATSSALPAPGHPAEDRLAQGPAPDGEAVWGPGSPKEYGSICERSWCFRPTVMNKAEDPLPDDQGWKPITWWSRQKTYYLMIKAEDLLPGDQGRLIAWWSRQKTYYLMIKAEDLLPGDQGRRLIAWWSRQKTYYLMIKAEDLLPGDQGSRLIAWWSRQKTYCLVIKEENLLPTMQ